MVLPVLSPIRTHFLLRGQAQRESQEVQKGKGDCVTWWSALGASHLSSVCVVKPGSLRFFLADTFCEYCGVAQSCFAREELVSAGSQQSPESAGQRQQEAAASQKWPE